MVKVSVVIPILNEAAWLPALLETLQRETLPHEVIVVDGGSCDRSIDIARAYHCRVLTCEPGRGQQLHSGASVASGDVLLFLHADSQFPAGGLTCICQQLDANPDSPGGNFRLLFDSQQGAESDPNPLVTDAFGQWLNGFYARIRTHGIYYGDSGIFVRRDCYRRLGGIQPISLMEDYDFVRKMEKMGSTICITEPPLVTSCRRFRGRRSSHIIWGWIWVHVMYYLNINPKIIANFYRSSEHSQI